MREWAEIAADVEVAMGLPDDVATIVDLTIKHHKAEVARAVFCYVLKHEQRRRTFAEIAGDVMWTKHRVLAAFNHGAIALARRDPGMVELIGKVAPALLQGRWS